jgi:hypothetical protein
VARLAAALGTVVGSAVVAGFVIDLLTFALARYGPQGGDGAAWSFRGNGALVVPFGVGPAVLAAAWTALVLRARGAARWLGGGAIVGLLGCGLVGSSILLLVVFGSAAQRLSDLLVYPTWIWMASAPVLAMFVPVRRTSAPRNKTVHILAGALFAVALAAVFLAAELVVSPGS